MSNEHFGGNGLGGQGRGGNDRHGDRGSDRDAGGGDRGSPRARARRPAAPGVRLSAVLPGARFIACDDIIATGCCDNPDRCEPGDVFVARLTGRGDGHDHVARALARGAAAVVAERMLPTSGKPLCIVPEGTGALARIAHALAGDPARRLRVIAVTGTSGKTTTAWLAAAVLAEAGLRVGVLADLGCLDADGAAPTPANLARPKVLAAWLRRLVDGGCTHVVVEVSSAMLAADCLAGIACDTVVVTNIASAHLDLHGTPAAYRAVKARILDSLAPDGCLVTDADDPRARRLARRHLRTRPQGGPSATLVTTALRRNADVTASPVERGLAGQTFLVRAGGHAMPVAVTTPVASFARDALLAAAVGLHEGVPLERIARGIEAAGSVPGRVERIDRGQDHAVFVDHPTSRHALGATLASLRRLTPGRLVVLAEPRVAARLAADGADRGPGAFERCVLDSADECVVVPDTLIHDDASAADVLAYARIDRLLSRLGGPDCLLVLGDAGLRRHTPTDPGGEPMPLATVVDGWLQLANEPQPWSPARRAA